jgi:hypothetical protein
MTDICWSGGNLQFWGFGDGTTTELALLHKENPTCLSGICTVNPLYNHALGDHFFFVTLLNCDLNV